MDKNIKANIYYSIHMGQQNINYFFDRKVSVSFDNLIYDKNAKYKVLVQIEPPGISNLTHSIINNKNNFDLILAWNEEILSKCENSVLFPFGSCWIDEDDFGIHNKTKNLSFITSSKSKTEGHKLRHKILMEHSLSLDLFGFQYNYIEKKITGLKDYMFSLIIENEKKKNWFTEKIIDCLVTGTVPIYWGCSNIGDFFNDKGFMQFNTIDEFKQIIPKLNQDTYSQLLPFIKENYELCVNYTNFWGRVGDTIKKHINNEK